ncbi:MAG: PRC-barrel domain-containing protein [Verrucomicrobia bacterium]|nr:PRC-barrel domain-containing protein [Verrucomicrobiota bacterium]
MKKTLRNIISASAVSVLAFSAVAQDAPKPNSDRPVYSNDRLQDGAEYNTERPDNRGDRMSQAREAGHIQGVAKASELIGMTVKNRQDETLGKVADLALDVESGRIVALIVSSGGFLGIGNELSAVPPTALRFNTDRDTLQLDATKEMLSNAPHFKADQWPDFGQPEYAGGVYRAFQVEPYFTTNVTTKADNTVRNVRDRNDATLTPFDQGNSQTDVATTAQIRREITAADGMSVNAQNVKIITQNGRVTLRGPVNTAEEKRLIGEIANRIATSGNVDNQLEVKHPAATTSRN